MVVKLSERPIDAVTALYQSDLATELAAIVADRGDAVTLDAPTAFVKHERAEVSGPNTLEVYDGGYEFQNPYSDADAERATYAIPIYVRATVFNRDNADAAKMALRRRRYQAALFNVVNKTPSVDATDDAIHIGVVAGVPDPLTERDDTGNVVKFQVSVRLLVTLEETQA